MKTTLYISTKDEKGHAHNFRMAPSEFVLDKGEVVTNVREATWKVSEMVPHNTNVRMHILMRTLEGVSTRR